MNTRPFGNTGITTSEIGLGCWQFGGDWGTCSDEDAMNTLSAAVDSGVTFFDTADVYGRGRSETLIGQFLKEKKLRGKITVATKLGRLAGYPSAYTLELFRKCTEDSLRRLNVPALDITQLHCVPKHYIKTGEVFGWLEILKKEGKIKHYGASVETMEEALGCLNHAGCQSLQIIFNIFRQKPIGMLFEKAKAKGVALIIRLPLASGLLSGKFTKTTTFPPQDHRTYNRDGQAFNVGETFAGLPFQKGIELVDGVKEIFTTAGLLSSASMAQLATRWILDHDAVSVVIPGAKDAQQARDNAAASALPPLSSAVHDELAKFYERQVRASIRGPY